MIAVWLFALVGGLALTVLASHRTLEGARDVAHRMGLSPFIVGMTVVALGTDLPEIANSITASATGHGDVNVGDSVGSSVTQITLVLGILCLFHRIPTNRRLIAVAGPLIAASVLLGALLMMDEKLGRVDGVVLLGCWVVGTILVQRRAHLVSTRQEALFASSVLTSLRTLVGGLVIIAGGALAAVWGVTEIAAWMGVPEYASSFLALSLGTSLPELVIDGNALRKGEASLALGNLVGSSFADATVSLGIGPALFPTVISASAAGGSLIAAGVLALALFWIWKRREHHRGSGVMLIVLYACAYLVILT